MKPILFDNNSISFTTNGIGRLSDAISCVVTEERNGLYELEMQYPITGAHYNDIGIQSILAVIPCDGGTMQAFRVYLISKPINGVVTINASHISSQLSHIPTMPFSIEASSEACASTLAALKENATEDCPFTFWTDLTTIAPYVQKQPASIRSRLGGIEGSVLDQFGGEYEWDNFTVKLHKQRGTLAENNGITLRYGKNITDITQEENIAETVTGVVPFWSDMDGTEVVTLPEHAVYSQYADNYPFHLTEVLDLSGNWEEKPSVSSLRTAAQAFVNKTGLGLPKVSIEVSFVALWQTEEYKDVAPLQRVKLCDEVTVEFEKLGISQIAKVVKTVYDVLAERYQSIQIGSLRSTLVTTLNDQNANTIQKIDASMVRVGDAINKATAWLTGSNGYIMAVQNQDGSWKELLAMDTNDPSTAIKVLRMNENGIGGSSSGIDGPYLSALLSDGSVVASRINTGILADTNNNFVLDLDNGTLTIGGNASMNGTTLSAMLTKITTTEEGLTSEVTRATNVENSLNSNYFGGYIPMNTNAPANAWTTDEIREKHRNDTFINYSNNNTYVYTYFDGGVYLTFDSRSETESTNFDYLQVYFWDESINKYRVTKKYGGEGNNNNISGLSLFVPASKFYVYWKSDSVATRWGFKITAATAGSRTNYMSGLYPNTADSLPSASTHTSLTGITTMPETAHPHGNNESVLWTWDTQIDISSRFMYDWMKAADVATAYSRIQQTADQIALKVSKGDVSSQLSVETGQITLSTGRLIISSGNFQLDANGTMTCEGAIIKGTIKIGGSGANYDYLGKLQIYGLDNTSVVGEFYGNYGLLKIPLYFGSTGQSYPLVIINDSNMVFGKSAGVYRGIEWNNGNVRLDVDTAQIWGGITIYGSSGTAGETPTFHSGVSTAFYDSGGVRHRVVNGIMVS
ncbi:MAG: phage tail protein [Lachnospiraceae bacterium]|nr:phage tail protein [Lachnospiraceae bacterium]